ncbi:hypothetical protein JEQ12_012913, partial [Ovis aries]
MVSWLRGHVTSGGVMLETVDMCPQDMVWGLCGSHPICKGQGRKTGLVISMDAILNYKSEDTEDYYTLLGCDELSS